MSEYDDIDAPVAPYSSTAEQGILGGLLLDNRLWDACGDVLKPSDFYDETNQEIYSALMVKILASKSADVITVFEALGGKVELAYLNSLAQMEFSFSSMRQYAEIIRERAVSRDMLSASAEIATLARDHNTDIEARVDSATGLLGKLLPDTAEDEWQSAEEGAIEFLDAMQRQLDGEDDGVIATGLRDLDEKLNGGVRPGELVIIGARPSMGKTALAVTIGMNAAENKIPVGMFSMEMPKSELQQRQFSMLSRVHLSKIRVAERLTQYDWSSVMQAADRVRMLNFWTTDKGGLNINQVRSRARKLKRRYGLKLLLVDYLGLMEGTDRKANRTTQLEEATRGLKMLAKELKIPIILLAQLNREVEKRTDNIPILSDLRDSGAIEQDADIVIFVHRAFDVKPGRGADRR